MARVHGSPVVGEDIEPFQETLYATATRIADEHEVPDPREPSR